MSYSTLHTFLNTVKTYYVLREIKIFPCSFLNLLWTFDWLILKVHNSNHILLMKKQKCSRMILYKYYHQKIQNSAVSWKSQWHQLLNIYKMTYYILSLIRSANHHPKGCISLQEPLYLISFPPQINHGFISIYACRA